MIIGIGCDIVEHKMTFHLKWLENTNILKRIFSKSEIELCPVNNPEKYYSSRFAVKEAILKCLNTGMEDGIALNDIDIKKDKNGNLRAVLGGQIREIAEIKKITNWHISLSHSRNSSFAFVIAEG